jgi:hypothetical protein
MKTINLDYDLYKKELQASREEGYTSGVYAAIEYIKNPSGWHLSDDKHCSRRKWLTEAVKMRNEKACEAYLDELIGEEKLLVFYKGENGFILDNVVSHSQNGDAIQLNVEES